MSLILASASPRRSQLLREAGVIFTVEPVDVEEIPAGPGVAPGIALRNAELKADASAAMHPDDTVIGADTVVELDGEIIGKPVDLADAKKILMRLSGKCHHVLTGVCIRNISRNIRVIFTDTTVVEFKPYDEKTVEQYMAQVNVLDKAGAYGIQEHGNLLVKKTKGYFSNIVGLPVERVLETLRLLGEYGESEARS